VIFATEMNITIELYCFLIALRRFNVVARDCYDRFAGSECSIRSCHTLMTIFIRICWLVKLEERAVIFCELRDDRLHLFSISLSVTNSTSLSANSGLAPLTILPEVWKGVASGLADASALRVVLQAPAMEKSGERRAVSRRR
jgi:hypothetical protein